MSQSIIGVKPPDDGRLWGAYCARCGNEMEFDPCNACDGDGMTEPGELHEQDPLWYHPDDTLPCHQCGGEGGFYFCVNSVDYCQANPMLGRESIERGAIEWFVLDENLRPSVPSVKSVVEKLPCNS